MAGKGADRETGREGGGKGEEHGGTKGSEEWMEMII